MKRLGWITSLGRVLRSHSHAAGRPRGRRRCGRDHGDIGAEDHDEFRQTFEMAVIGQAHCDWKGRFLKVNRALCQITGYSADELRALTFRDITHPDDLATNAERHQEMLDGRAPGYAFEKRYVRRDGSTVWVAVSVTLVRDAGGRPLRVAVIVQDVDARRRGELAQAQLVRTLEAERGKLREIFAAAPAFLCTLAGPQHVLECANRMFYQLVGDRELVGQPLRQALPDLAGQPFFALLDQVYRSGEPFVAHGMPIVLDRAGPRPPEPRYVNFVYQPLRDADGRVTGILVHGVDVTEQKLAERALRDSEERFRTLVANLPGAVYRCRIDADWTMDFISDGVERLTGYPAREFAENLRSFASLIPPEDDARNRELVEQAVAGRRSFSLEYRLQHADGSTRWIFETGQVYLDADGKPAWLDGVMFDATERRRATEQLRFQEAVLRSQAECAIDGILVVGPDRRIISMNRRFGEIWGIPEHVLATGDESAALAAVHGKLADPGAFLRRVEHLMEHPTEASREEILLNDGRVLDRYSSALVGADGTNHGRIWYFRDVSNERRADQALRESEGLLRRMFEASPDCIQTLDLEGHLLSMNPCGMRLMEVDDFAHLSGAHWGSFWKGAEREAAERALATARAGGAGSFEGFCPTLQGTPKWWHVVVTAIPDADGRPQRLLSISRDLSDRHALESRLRYESLHDALTALPNRTLFNEQVGRCIERSKADPSYEFAVLFFDLDRFKVINDSLGHAAGDRLLVTVADRLRRCVREAGCVAPASADVAVARLGGDEFTLLLDAVRDPADVERLAERILAAVAEPLDFDGHEVTTAASIGIVRCGGPAGVAYDAAKDLLRDADTAMYRAKGAGRNRLAVFDAPMHAAAVRRLRLETDLRRALERGELLLHYQPIVSLSTRELEGFEALARWRRDGRLVSPAEFIPVAEDTGLIVPIGAWVLAEACRQLAAWRRAHPDRPHLSMAVNLSRRQLADAHLLPLVTRVLAETGVAPASVKLEVTESVIMDDDAAGRRVLGELKRLGVRLSMDDFGTGYSSLSCLHKFPIDVLKVDRSFVANLQGRRDASAVVLTIVQLAHHLRMQVVAEGLETPEQVAFLQSVDCDYGQGYLFSKPLPADEAEAFLRAQSLQTCADAA